MNPVELNTPAGAKVLFNALYRTRDPRLLTADLLAISLPNGRVLDVSWHPERSPEGSYTITVFHGTWAQRERELEVKDIDGVLKAVQELCHEYCTPEGGVNGSGSTAAHSEAIKPVG